MSDEHQKEFNDRITRTMEKLTDTVADLEKHTVIVESMAISVRDHETRIDDIEKSMDFVKGAKAVFIALVIALIIGSATAVWQVVKNDKALSKDDVAELIKAVKTSKP